MAVAVSDLEVDRQIADVEQVGAAHGWRFERVGSRCFRVDLTARNGDVYQLEVVCERFPTVPPSFHWRNPETGRLDEPTDAPKPYNFFHGSGMICAPWNRLASAEGAPHPEWELTGWQHNDSTKGAVTLAAMLLRIRHELRSSQYAGRGL